MQGDITGFVDTSGNQMVTYTYDAWGNVIDVSGLYTYMGYLNGLRYRGYYYDNETNSYYLQSRYYNPQLCRFINADDGRFIGASGTLLSKNAFAYCENNPVNNVDHTGTISFKLKAALTVGFGWGIVEMCNKCTGMKMRNWKAWAKVGLSFAMGFVKGFFTVYETLSFYSNKKFLKKIAIGVIYAFLDWTLGKVKNVKQCIGAFLDGYANGCFPSLFKGKWAAVKEVVTYLSNLFVIEVY